MMQRPLSRPMLALLSLVCVGCAVGVGFAAYDIALAASGDATAARAVQVALMIALAIAGVSLLRTRRA